MTQKRRGFESPPGASRIIGSNFLKFQTWFECAETVVSGKQRKVLPELQDATTGGSHQRCRPRRRQRRRSQANRKISAHVGKAQSGHKLD